MSWCERHDIGYIIGLAKNARLVALAAPEMDRTEASFAAIGAKQRRFCELAYGAKTWDRQRRVIARLEHGLALSNAAMFMNIL